MTARPRTVVPLTVLLGLVIAALLALGQMQP